VGDKGGIRILISFFGVKEIVKNHWGVRNTLHWGVPPLAMGNLQLFSHGGLTRGGLVWYSRLSMDDRVSGQVANLTGMVHSRVMPEDIPDVLQDLTLALWMSIPKYRGESSIETYSRAVAMNVIAEYWRKQYRWKKKVRAAIDGYSEYPQVEAEKYPISRLTEAERGVLRCLGMGLDNEEMGKKLFISVNTVRRHLKNAYKKLGCSDRVRVALLAHKVFQEEK
jgi:RNA polymerase sigma factor (sigma-70 family)